MRISPHSQLLTGKKKIIGRSYGKIYFLTHNSPLEGATELKFVPFCSS